MGRNKEGSYKNEISKVNSKNARERYRRLREEDQEEKYNKFLGLDLLLHTTKLSTQFRSLHSSYKRKAKQKDPRRYYFCLFLATVVKKKSDLGVYEKALTALNKVESNPEEYERKYIDMCRMLGIWTAYDTTKARKASSSAEGAGSSSDVQPRSVRVPLILALRQTHPPAQAGSNSSHAQRKNVLSEKRANPNDQQVPEAAKILLGIKKARS